MDAAGRLDEPLLAEDTPPFSLTSNAVSALRLMPKRAPEPVPESLPNQMPNQIFARMACECGGRLLKEIDGPDGHAVFDATLEHAMRLFEASTGLDQQISRKQLPCSRLPSRGNSFEDSPRALPFRRSTSDMEKRIHEDDGTTMDMDSLRKALELEGFAKLEGPLFQALWRSLGKESVDVRAFHRVLRLLKLHLLCGSLPDITSGDRLRPPLEPERGFVGVIDWNPRTVRENYFERTDDLDIFLSHRHPAMKMRWVHCSDVGKATILRLAVKYQLHPLPVEDTMQLQQQSMPVMRIYHHNFFIILPLLRLTTPARNELERFERARHDRDGDETLPRRASSRSIVLDPDSQAPCEVCIEQGRVALFVAGPPKFDTVISVQTKWVTHQSDDGTNQSSESPRLSEIRFCRRRRRFGGRSARTFARNTFADEDTSRSMRTDSFFADSPEASPRQSDCDIDDAELGVSGVRARDNDATEAFDAIAEEIKQDCSVLRSGNAPWLLWRVVDVVVDDMQPILAAFRARLQWFTAHIARRRAKSDNDVEKKLLWTRVELEWVQRKVRPISRVVRQMIHDKSIVGDVTQYLEDVEDHLETYIEELSRSIGVCDSLRDQVRSFRDREQQGVVYVLALVTTMTTPLQLLASMYGMNFIDDSGKPVVPGLGRLEKQRGYCLFWGLGVAIVSAIYISFRYVLKWM